MLITKESINEYSMDLDKVNQLLSNSDIIDKVIQVTYSTDNKLNNKEILVVGSKEPYIYFIVDLSNFTQKRVHQNQLAQSLDVPNIQSVGVFNSVTMDLSIYYEL